MSNDPQSTDGDNSVRSARPVQRSDIRSYWRCNLILIGVLLSIWAIVSYGCGILWVEYLNQFRMGQLPLGFWFAQQGSIYVFVILIFVYAFAMDQLDRRFGVQE
ncbi:MAG: DUF4212 domain-containing protein [Pirellulales bacterium]